MAFGTTTIASAPAMMTWIFLIELMEERFQHWEHVLSGSRLRRLQFRLYYVSIGKVYLSVLSRQLFLIWRSTGNQ